MNAHYFQIKKYIDMTFKFKFFAAMAVLVFSSISLIAQSEADVMPHQNKERAQNRGNKLAEKLGLSEEAAVEFKAINKKYRQQLNEAKANVTSKAEMADIKYANHKAKNAEVKAFLTPEQYAIYDKVEPRKGKKGKGMRGGKGGKAGKGGKQKRKL